MYDALGKVVGVFDGDTVVILTAENSQENPPLGHRCTRENAGFWSKIQRKPLKSRVF
jgi:hypothetical protein